MRTTVIRVFAVLALLFVFTSLVFGQADTGQVTGTVTDPSGAIVAGAKVTITDVNTNASRTATTNSAGLYTFTNLKPSTYDVIVEGSGFAKFTRRVDVTVGSKNEVSAQMSVTGGGTTVEVTAEGGAAQVNTESQTLSSVVTGKQITELPTLTRNPYDLVATSGNVSDADADNRGAGFAINGQRSASTDILLDGGENVDSFTATVGQQVPLDSVQELRIVTSDFTAEYGRASGGVINVATKSGTNTFHGTAYEFNRVSALAANTWENDANDIKKGGFTRNQPGYSIGGPIIKNKLFFFNNTEWIRVRSSSNQLVSVIDPGMYPFLPANTVAALSAASIRPSATVIGKTTCGEDPLCAGQLPANTPFTDQLSYSLPANSGGSNPENTWMTVGRVDYNMTDKTTFFGRYAGYHEIDFAGTVNSSPYAGFDTGQSIFNNNILINMTHIFSPNFVSQSKIDYNRLNNVQPLGTQAVGPTLYVSSLGVPTSGPQIGASGPQGALVFPGYNAFTPGNAIPFGGPQNLYQAYQDFSWTKGKHQFRFGGQYVQIRDNRSFGAYEEAVQYLSTGGGAAGIGNLIAGNMAELNVAVYPQGQYPGGTINLPVSAPDFARNNRYNDGAFYGQDSWKVMPRLTLNLGLRWEYYGVQHNANPNLDSNFYGANLGTTPLDFENGSVQLAPKSPIGELWQPSKHNFGPRLGFAWDVFGDGKTSIRGGYGISYERNFGNVTFNVIQNPPNYAVLDVLNTPITQNNFGPLGGSAGSVTLPPVTLRGVQPNINNAYSEFFSLALEREVLKNSVLAFEYSGSHGIHLYDIGNANVPGYGSYFDPATYGGTGCDPFCRLNSQYGNINTRGSEGFSRYNALNTRFTTNNLFNEGLQLNFNWTWSHNIDNLSSTFSDGGDGNFQLGYENYFEPQDDKGNAEFDERHRVVISGVWDIPWMKKSSNAVVRAALGGWSFAPIFTYHTGSPFSVYDCTNGISQCPRWIPGNAVSLTGGASAATYQGGGVFDYLALSGPGGLAQSPYAGTSFLYTGVIGNGAGYGTPGVGGSSQAPAVACQNGIGCQFSPGPRNMFTGPGNQQFNAVFAKTFKLSERFDLQFRGELYDVFNHHNFYLLTSNADVSVDCNACYGANVASTYTHVQAEKGGFGDPATDERRNVQFGLKLTF
jgi:outer membrane receptor protein involved in Fe transport